MSVLRPRLRARGGGIVGEAVDYALSGSGKRVRGILLILSHAASGGQRDVGGLAAAVEVIHAYSLVHDDLPCMDDDDLRRGQPTVHRRFDVPTATVAGVTMVPLAISAIVEGAALAGLPPRASATIVNEMIRSAGGGGMIGGQLLDIEAEGRALPMTELDRVHAGKTGALFAGVCAAGGLAADASSAQVAALAGFGSAFGLAYQITDDVLDVVASAAERGKSSGRDEALNKSTYPGAVGVSGAASRAYSLVRDAESRLAAAGLGTERLLRFARLSVGRAA